MGEKALIDSRTAAFRSRWAGLSAERLGFRPQMDTLAGFLSGKGRPEDKRLTMTVNGRTEVWHRHEPGFQNRKLKVLYIGAHPDDTALSEGLEHVLVEQGKVDGKKDTGLAVISVTPGQKMGDVKTRINEDVASSKRLGADFYTNLGFMDGFGWGYIDYHKEKAEIKNRLKHYLKYLQPDIVILADPKDISHPDHVAVSDAAVTALQENEQKPIVVYTDHQYGDDEVEEDAFAFSLTNTQHQTFQDAFLLDHPSQTRGSNPNVWEVIQRPAKLAVDLNSSNKFVGVGRQDKRFSQEPIRKYLGDQYVQLPQGKERQFRRKKDVIVDSPTPYNLTEDEIKANLPLITDGLTKLMADATGWSYAKCLPMIEDRVREFNRAVAIVEGGQLLSFGGYTVYSIDGFGKILYESIKMTAKSVQGQGLGRFVTNRAFKLEKPDFFALRTQNPAEVASVQNTFKESEFAPFDFNYASDPDLQAVLVFMQLMFGVENYNPQTGICPGYYGQRVGDYIINTQNPQINTIHHRLNELGLNRDRGDAVFMIGRVGKQTEQIKDEVVFEKQYA